MSRQLTIDAIVCLSVCVGRFVKPWFGVLWAGTTQTDLNYQCALHFKFVKIVGSTPPVE